MGDGEERVALPFEPQRGVQHVEAEGVVSQVQARCEAASTLVRRVIVRRRLVEQALEQIDELVAEGLVGLPQPGTAERRDRSPVADRAERKGGPGRRGSVGREGRQARREGRLEDAAVRLDVVELAKPPQGLAPHARVVVTRGLDERLDTTEPPFAASGEGERRAHAHERRGPPSLSSTSESVPTRSSGCSPSRRATAEGGAMAPDRANAVRA